MACSKTTLETDACSNGFAQAAQNEAQFRALVLQLLCTISEIAPSGGTGLYSGNYGGVAPGISPPETTAIAFDTVTGTQWNWYLGVWH